MATLLLANENCRCPVVAEFGLALEEPDSWELSAYWPCLAWRRWFERFPPDGLSFDSDSSDASDSIIALSQECSNRRFPTLLN